MKTCAPVYLLGILDHQRKVRSAWTVLRELAQFRHHGPRLNPQPPKTP